MLHQVTTVSNEKLIVGNYKIETASSVGASYVNLGAGKVNSFKHEVTKYDTQAGNAPDPLEGIADEKFIIDMEMIEYDASVISAMSCGISTSSSTTAQSVMNAGGNEDLTPRVFRLTNTRKISGTTKQTIILVYYATMDQGIQMTAKADGESDPIGIMPVVITGKNDSSRTAGSQLYSITKDL